MSRYPTILPKRPCLLAISTRRAALGLFRAAIDRSGADGTGRYQRHRGRMISRVHGGFAALTLLVLSFLATGARAEQAAAISIQVRPDGVTVSDVTPGGTVVLFACTRGSRHGRTHVGRHALMLTDEDGDGVVQFSPAGGILLRSVWVAVDSGSGAPAVGSHPDFPLRTAEINPTAFRKDAEGEIVRFEQEIRRVLLLVVRPGKGAWTLFGHDGNPADGDRAVNGRVSLEFLHTRRVDGTDAPLKHLKAGDVIVAIDPNDLDVYVTRIGK